MWNLARPQNDQFHLSTLVFFDTVHPLCCAFVWRPASRNMLRVCMQSKRNFFTLNKFICRHFHFDLTSWEECFIRIQHKSFRAKLSMASGKLYTTLTQSAYDPKSPLLWSRFSRILDLVLYPRLCTSKALEATSSILCGNGLISFVVSLHKGSITLRASTLFF